MSESTENFEIAKAWLAGQDLTSVSPAEAKQMFFKALHEIETTNVERWD